VSLATSSIPSSAVHSQLALAIPVLPGHGSCNLQPRSDLGNRKAAQVDGTVPDSSGLDGPSGQRVADGGRARHVAARLARAALLLFAAYYVLALLLMVVFRFVAPPVTGVQLQRRVEAVVTGRDYDVARDYRAMSTMAAHAPRAVVAAEDGRFWDHAGFDLKEMRAAGQEALSGGRVRGASTITQQLMKNLFGCACRNPVRKVYDVALTPAAELILGKDRILELYLNVVEWGDGVYGIEAAAQHHYNVSAARLSRTQAAGLAALLPAPRHRTPANTAGYRASILRRMSQRGW
jgi:monofunctional glycosyltransferase